MNYREINNEQIKKLFQIILHLIMFDYEKINDFSLRDESFLFFLNSF